MLKTLLQLIEKYNKHAKEIGNYEITYKQTKNKISKYQILNITENGLKHKYAGKLKDVCKWLVVQTDYEEDNIMTKAK